MSKLCKKCHKKLIPEEKGVCLHTFKGEKSLEKVYWHWECYNLWLNDSIMNKASNIFNDAISKSFPKIIEVLNNGRTH